MSTASNLERDQQNERLALLRSVNLFAGTPEHILSEIARLLKPLHFPTDHTIFNKGDCGDCLYIITSGHIRIHDGEMQLNYLNPGDVFGELALLDSEPRVASATTSGETTLLQLAQQPFFDYMANRLEIARAILRVVTHYLRSMVYERGADFQYIQEVGRITAAAAALEAGIYTPAILDSVGQRSDELGHLARVFQKMANEVQAREQRLQQEVETLRIRIDEVQRTRLVAEITESDYFHRLQQRASQLRKRRQLG